jgi:hypothetical protein
LIVKRFETKKKHSVPGAVYVNAGDWGQLQKRMETLNIMRVPIAGLIKNSIIEAVIDDRGFG